ncbi:MAG TPA: hypothetical protein PKD59_16420 [Miltoncostaeaceae bacterium]|nr:hypothetical protein [Miltoncostaeaceae bacterium]
MTDDGFGRAITTIRAGLSLGAAAAILLAISPLFDVVTGPAAAPPGTEFTAGVGTSVGVGAAIGAIVIIAAVAQRVLWQHLLGIVVTTGVALLSALLVISARTADEFADGADVTLQAGGVLLIAAFWLALIAVVVALVGIRMVALAAPPPVIPASRRGELVRARTSSIAAALGAAGVVLVITAGAAIAYGVLALGDIRASDGRLTGRGFAMTGVILGGLVLSLLAAVGGVGSLTASPG